MAYWWGFTYNDVVPECYIITMDGLESEPFADVAPYIFEDLGRAYAVVKKQYRNTDLKKHVIGLNLVEIHSLDSVYQKFTWPMWECIESMHNGVILTTACSHTTSPKPSATATSTAATGQSVAS